MIFINTSISLTGSKIAREMVDNHDEMAEFIKEYIKKLDNEGIVELHEALMECNGCEAARKLGVILSNMQG